MSVRAHQHSVGQKNKAARPLGAAKGLGAKLHATMNALGHGLCPDARAGARSARSRCAITVLCAGHTIITDKGHDAHERVNEPLMAAGKKALISAHSPNRAQRQCDSDLYKTCHAVVSFFAKRKQY